MKHERLIESLPAYLEGALAEAKQREIADHLKTCKSCREEVAALETVLASFGQEKELVPPASLRKNFEAMLEKEKLEAVKVVPLPDEKQKTKHKLAYSLLKLAAGITLLIGAYALGEFQNSRQVNQEIASLEAQQVELKQTTMLSLMENRSASRRIQGVSYIEEFPNPDEAIVKALADRILQDENANVRLTAVEALQQFTASETVKNAFIEALKKEKDPNIQIIIIQTLVKIQEKKAIEPMRQLLQEETTQPFIKEQIKSSLPNII